MVKGTIAKETITNKIIAALGDDFIGTFDNKLYTWADDGNDRVQISIALTCPKVMRGIEETGPAVLNFDDEPSTVKPAPFKAAEVTKEEQDTLAALMQKLGL
jgi:hypothetical protein